MPTFTFAPQTTGLFVNWSNPAVWQGGVVPAGADADVVFPPVYEVATGFPRPYYVSINTGESYAVRSVTMDSDYLLLTGTLTAGGTFTLHPGSELDMQGGQLSAGTLVNEGLGIQGSGSVSSAAAMVNAGSIAGSGLSITAPSFRNTGTVIASSALSISAGAAGLLDLSGGVLTGGTFGATGNGTLQLTGGSPVVTDAASIVLGSQYGSVSETNTIAVFDDTVGRYRTLQETLQTVAASGRLSLFHDTFETANTLTVDGTLALAAGTLRTPRLVVGTGGTVSADGTVTAPVTNNGVLGSAPAPGGPLLYTAGPALLVQGDVGGAGSLHVGAGALAYITTRSARPIWSTLELGGAAAQDVVFANGLGVLRLDVPQSFTGTLRGFTGQDQLILGGIALSSVTGYSFSGDAQGGMLTVQQGGSALSVHLAGDYTRTGFHLAAGPQVLSTNPPSLLVTLGTSYGVVADNAVRRADQASTTSFSFYVTREGDASAGATVAYAVTGSGTNPAAASQFPSTAGTVFFYPYETSEYVSVSVAPGTVPADEQFTVALSSIPAGANMGAAATGTIQGNGLRLADLTAGTSAVTGMQPYSGPVAGLRYTYIDLSPDNLALSSSVPDAFLHTGSGTDAIDVSGAGGSNVLDGGTGSNFLVGGTGSGHDTFFVDDRVATADIWSTVVNVHAGDDATVFGVTPQEFSLAWADGEGAPGYTGLTLHATAPGRPTASLTLAGYTRADLGNGRLSVSFGVVGDSPYLLIHANG